MTTPNELPPPRARFDFLGAPDFEATLAQTLNAGALANGWLITGGEGAGKATLAYRLARALLWRERPENAPNLEVPKSAREYALVASGGHPDLFVADRRFDEKKDRYATEISIEVVRELTHFLSQTASMGGWRVAIIDTADDLNRNSANALLKALEEPPSRTALFVLSSAPGRLLATIRSRCRRIELRSLPDHVVAEFLRREGAAKGEVAPKLAEAAGGRPGFALSLALGDGADAVEAVESFWEATTSGKDVGSIAQRLAAKDADGAFRHFQSLLTARIAQQAKSLALAADSRSQKFVDLREAIDRLFTRGEAVNLDKVQIVLAAGRAFAAVMR